MKKLLLFIFIALLCTASYSQSQKDIAKERKEVAKLSKKELQDKVTKTAKIEARRFTKDGWLTTPGSIPIAKQIDRALLLQYEYDKDLFPRYLMAEAMSIGGNYDAAKMQAIELAKLSIAGQIQTEITALIESTIANQQLEEEEAATITKTVAASKNEITQSIGRVLPVIELYRELPNKNKEVMVRIAYNTDNVKTMTRKIVQKKLEEKGDKLHEQLNEKLKW